MLGVLYCVSTTPLTIWPSIYTMHLVAAYFTGVQLTLAFRVVVMLRPRPSRPEDGKTGQVGSADNLNAEDRGQG